MNSMNLIILEVVLPTPVRRCFDYLPPIESSDAVPIQPGCRVLVPFGPSKRIALVTKIKSHSEVEPSKLKACLSVLDKVPLLDEEILKLASWASTYYHYSLGNICFKMLPALTRKNSKLSVKKTIYWKITSQAPSLNSITRAPKQRLCLELLTSSTAGLSELELKSKKIQIQTLRTLKEALWIESYEKDRLTTLNVQRSDDHRSAPKLTKEQQLAVDSCQLDKFQVHLLDGITGSGKTEVYLQLIIKVLSQGKQILVLVPEIGLTPQLVNRFQNRLNMPIGLFHSGLNNQQRYENWQLTVNGDYQILIGTRSALFTPMKDLGLIIIDEEHDPSFKQQQGWLYSARDLALVRARNKNIPVVLGSATASLETLQNALDGKYQHLKLRQRPGSVSKPMFQTFDIRRLPMEQGLSRPLIETIGAHLSQGNQVIIFLNRRGFAPILMCHDCGWRANCERCETSYTLHQSPKHLHCHHCDTSRQVPSKCPDCDSQNITAVGIGTERIESLLEQKFPDYPLIRIDRDSTRRKDSMKNYIEDINKGHYKILVGTQMLSKGHHFPNVSLVAIVDMDSALFSSDFRASEKFAQQLIQVAGRAGRAEKPGVVVIQTRHPEHPQIQTLIKDGYDSFARDLLVEREQCLWPPYSYLALFRAEAKIAALPDQFLTEVAEIARTNIDNDHPISILGPIAAPMHRRAGNYRVQLLLQAKSRKSLQKLLRYLIIEIESKKSSKTVRWSLDVDPQEMF